MNILVVVGTLSGQGGIETCVRAISLQAKANGDIAHVLALCPSTTDARWHDGLSYSEVTLGSPSLKWQGFRGIPAIIREVRERKPDVIVVIYSSTVLLAKIALALCRARIPVVSWLHFSSFLQQRLYLLKYADAHLCISSANAEYLQARPDIERDRVHLIFNGAGVADAKPVDRSCEGPIRLIYIGRLMIGLQKRTDELLRALARVEGDWRLDVYGAGDDLPSLQHMAKEEGIADRIAWHGWRPNVWSAIDAADVLILCSSFEGFPMVLIEGMARGVPCISSDCPSGPSDIVQDGVNGWLYPVGDVEALAGLVRKIVSDRSSLPDRDAVQSSVLKFDIAEVYRRFRTALAATLNRAQS